MLATTRRTEGVPARRHNPLALLREEMDAMFDRFLGTWMIPDDVLFRNLPAVEWEEAENEFVLRAPVPGFAPEEVVVNLLGNELTFRAEHREEEKGAETDHVERYGRIERTVTLPVGADPAKVEARWVNGMLEVHVPRLPGATPRRIPVAT